MRGFTIKRVRTAVSGILTKNKGKADRRFTGPALHQAMVGGFRIALMAPFCLLLVGAIGDYEGLRQFLLTATSAEMGQTVLLIIVGGYFIGGFVQMMIDATFPKMPDYSSGISLEDRLPSAAWFWDQRPEGRDLAIREATIARNSPNADTRWALDDLLKELGRSENLGGSDLLDRKIMQLLGIQSQPLKPTQKLEDAIRLLSLRYRGLPSRYEWDVKTEHLSSGCKAFVSARVPAKSPAAEPEPWQRCLVVDGPSEALAVTIAAITRETWTFTT